MEIMLGAMNQTTTRMLRSFVARATLIAAYIHTVPGGLALGAEADFEQMVLTATSKLSDGEFQAAIDGYEQAFENGQPTPRMIYNKAVAHYRQGDTETARQLFAQAADSPKLAAQARYNMGNADYSEAVKFWQEFQSQGQGQQPRKNETTETPDIDQIIGKLRTAISHYKRSLAADPTDADARANIESAHKFARKLEQIQQKKEEQQQEDQQSQQQQDQQQQNQQDKSESESQQDQQKQDGSSEDQPNDTEQSEEPSNEDAQSQNQQQEDQQSQDGSEQKQPDQQDGKQQQQQQQSGSQSDKESEDQQPSNPGDQQQDPSSQNQAQQQSSGEQSDEPKDDDSSPQAQPSDQAPQGELKPQNGANPNAQPQELPDSFKPGQRMTMQEAQKMMQAIRDRDFRRRLEKLRQMRTRRVRVEKDW